MGGGYLYMYMYLLLLPIISIQYINGRWPEVGVACVGGVASAPAVHCNNEGLKHDFEYETLKSEWSEYET